QIGIEIVLSREDVLAADLASHREACTHCVLDDFSVQDGKRAGLPRTNRTSIRIRPQVGDRHAFRSASRASAEDLRIRRELGVDFEPENDFPFGMEPGGNRGGSHHASPFSIAFPTFRTMSSRNCGAITCRPIGRFFASTPHGTLMPGSPARLHGIVRISFRYIFNGSDAFSPFR